jgi:hypothetical protein
MLINHIIALSTTGCCIADLMQEIIDGDYDADIRLANICGMDSLPDEIAEPLLDNPHDKDALYRLFCLGLSACALLARSELITFVTKAAQQRCLTEQ